MVSSNSQIAVHVCERLRRSTRINRAIVASIILLHVAIVTIVAGVFASHLAPILVRDTVLVSLGVLSLLLIFQTVRAFRYGKSLTWYAAYVERNTPEFRSSLVTSIQLQEDERLVVPDWVENGLATQVEKSVPQIPVDTVTGRSAQHKAFVALACTVAVLAAITLNYRAEVQNGLLDLFAPIIASDTDGPSDTQTDTVVHSIAIDVIPPAYTNLQSRALPGFSGHLSVYPGTEIAVRGLAALENTSDLFVVLPSDQDERRLQEQQSCLSREELSEKAHQACRSEDLWANDVRFSFECSQGGYKKVGFSCVEPKTLRLNESRFEFRHLVTSGGPFWFGAIADDWTYTQSRPYRLDLQVDETPRVRILFPPQDSEVRIDDEVRVMFEARDDFGIAAVRRKTHVEGRKNEQTRNVGSPDATRLYSTSDTLDLRDIGASPGDVVVVSYEAKDTNTVNGPQTAQSAPRRFKIFSPDEQHQKNLEKEQALFEELIIRLAERLVFEPNWKAGQAPEEAYAEYRRMLREEAVYLRSFDELVRGLIEDPQTTDLIRSSLETILKQQRELHQQDTTNANNIYGRDLENPVRIRRAFRLHSKIIDRFEYDVLALDDLVVQQRQDRLASDSERLKDRSEELRSLIAAMKDKASDSKMRQALDVLDRLSQRVNDMRQEMGKMAQKMPDENFNPDALLRQKNNVGLSDVDKRLEQIRQLLKDGRLEEALKLAESLERDVQQLSEQMQEGVMRPRKSGGNSQMSKDVQRSMRDLDNLARKQEKLIKQTERLEAKERAALKKRFDEGLDKELEEAKKKVSDVSDRLQQIPKKPLHPYDKKALNEAEKELDRLGKRLESRDIQKASEQAKKLSKKMEQLAMEMKLSARRNQKARKKMQKARKMRKASGQCKKAGDQLSELADDLDSLVPEPQESLGKKGVKKAKDLQKKQSALRKELGKATKKLDKLGENAPSLKRLVKGMSQGAERMMERASKRLGDGNPKHARPHQEDALERLKSARDQLKNAMKPNGSHGGAESVGVRPSTEPVEIPGKEAHKVPRNFRNLLMRTMKEKIPDRYDGALEQYFRELAQ